MTTPRVVRTSAKIALAALLLCATSQLALARPAGPNGIASQSTEPSVTGGQLRWLCIGDWGAAPGDAKHLQKQQEVAQLMASVSTTFKPDMIINVGDNFYNDGVTSTSDSRWQTTWLDVYKPVENNMNWWSVLGNHDYIDNPQAEVEYCQQGLGGGKWKMPGRYYTHTFAPSNAPSVQFVFIDTMMLSPDGTMELAYEELAKGEVTAEQVGKLGDNLVRDGRTEMNNATIQLQWIQATLAASTADWLFVVGHYPVYSGGENKNNPQLQANLKPLLEKYPVDAYLCGHDHSLQVLQSGGVVYYVSGGGSKHTHHLTTLPQTLYGDATEGFDTMMVDSTTLTVTLHKHDGDVLYTHSQQRRPKM